MLTSFFTVHLTLMSSLFWPPGQGAEGCRIELFVIVR
jgi:hypothetical protein